MTLLIFTHVDSGHHILIIEEELRQSLCKLGLSDTCRTHEEEGAYRPLLVLQSRTGTADRICNSLYGHILAHYPLVKLGLHAKQLLTLALQHPLYRNACPLGNHLSDIFRSHRLGYYRILYCSLTRSQLLDLLLCLSHLSIADLSHLAIVSDPFGIMRLYLIVLDQLPLRLKFRQNALLLVPTLPQRVTLLHKFLQLRLDLVHLERHALTLDGLTLDLKLPYAAVQLRYRLGNGVHLEPELRGRLVHEVYGLVRQKTACDVSVRKFYRSNKGIIFDADLVVVFITFLQTSHYGNGSRRRRLIDHHHLETALQSLVSLEVFLIFIKSGGAYGAELAPCERRLEDIRCIHGTRGASGPYQRMDFINEKNHFSLTFNDFLYNSLEAFLKLSLILGTGDERAHVK